MKTQLWLFVLLLSITPLFIAYGQGEKKPRTIDDYQLRTLKELSSLVPETIASAPEYKDQAKDLRIIVHAQLLPSRVKVTYDGNTRALHEAKKSLIKEWANRFAGAPEFYTRPYETEALFTENGEHFWLAVRNEFLPKFAQELKKGDVIELFLIKMGNIRIDNQLEPVVLIEKYLE